MIWMPKKYRQEKAMREAQATPGVDMSHIIKREGRTGWKQLTDPKTGLLVDVWEFIHEKGYGHVTKIQGRYEWEANRGDRPADQGSRSNLEDARSAVVRIICG